MYGNAGFIGRKINEKEGSLEKQISVKKVAEN